MEISDIDGSKPKNLTNSRRSDYSSMNYRDVTHADFKTKRSTNPLNPTYVVRDEDDKVISIGEIERNKPREGPVRHVGPVSQDLQTTDINGAMASTKGKGPFFERTRKDFRVIN